MQGAQGTIRGITLLPGGFDIGVPKNISGDGRTVIGYMDNSGVANSRTGFYWNEDDGTVELPKLPGFLQMEPFDVSFDGSVIVGKQRVSDASGVETAFMWNADDGTVDLLVGAGTKGQALAVSADGTRICIHTSTGGAGTEQPGAVWVDGVGLVDLEIPPNPFGGDPSPCKPYCISGDGSVIGGFYDKFSGVQTFPPTLWDGTTGDLISVLTGTATAAILSLTDDASKGFGVITTSPLIHAVDLSAHGKTLVVNRVSANTLVSWSGGSSVSVVTHAGVSVPTRFPLSGVTLGDGVSIMPEVGNVSEFRTAANGLIYSLRRTNPLDPTHNQATRVTMLVRHDYP